MGTAAMAGGATVTRGKGKSSRRTITRWGADLADSQQLGRSQPPVLQGEWVEMPPQSQRGLGCGVPPLHFVDELWLGLGMSWLFF